MLLSSMFDRNPRVSKSGKKAVTKEDKWKESVSIFSCFLYVFHMIFPPVIRYVPSLFISGHLHFSLVGSIII